MEYRFFCMQSHYRNALVFSHDSFDNAANAYRKLKQRILAIPDEGAVDEAKFSEYKKAFCDAMDADLNTSLAVTCVYDVVKAKDLNGATKRALLADFDKVLSLDLLKAEEKQEKQAQGISAEEIEKRIAERAAAKKAKNYAEADRIRGELSALGVTLIDTPSGTTYKIN